MFLFRSSMQAIVYTPSLPPGVDLAQVFCRSVMKKEWQKVDPGIEIR
jgi:hypothetical protein